ncbi:costars-domain-containing protein [Ephemerocybe angulata]|uniref:Costars-domain-containing protein n=1 Tax=Ephemerocybe angulata TaxID=980116 RepID=A0A8H6HLI0_9AGAR|nr:costars-domain-containing protein [Tulosesus angulatus]
MDKKSPLPLACMDMPREIRQLVNTADFGGPALTDELKSLEDCARPALLDDKANKALSLATSCLNLNTEHEISILKKAIKDNGTVNADGKSSVSYGVLFNKTADTLEALNGTLRAAKRQKKVAFDAELLMMPKDKDVQVVLLED